VYTKLYSRVYIYLVAPKITIFWPPHHETIDPRRHSHSLFHCPALGMIGTSSWLHLTFTVLLIWTETIHSLQLPSWSTKKTPSFDYDLLVVGAGASGLFAAGASSGLFGKRTALVDLDVNDGQVGGDCSNAACVPSKAVRSVARQAANSKNNKDDSMGWWDTAGQHLTDTVEAVRNRENPQQMQEGNPNLQLVFCRDCRFVGPHSLQITTQRQSTNSSTLLLTADNNNRTVTTVLTSRKFLICTGASPIIPEAWETQAAAANLPLWTYRSVLRPTRDANFWDWIQSSDQNASNKTNKRLLIVGGGATACELGQSIARLAKAAGSNLRSPVVVDIELVAPAILPDEDVTLQQSALKLLVRAGIKCHLGARATAIRPDKSIVLSSGDTLPSFDGLLVCVGRSPAPSLDSLELDQAGVAWDPDQGVLVDEASLQSFTAPHVYAAGDCASVVTDRTRTAAHAAWTGFYAVRNTVLPWILRVGGDSIHSTVPRVIYTDPELACVGLTQRECIERFGAAGYDSLYVPEEGSDRADMERRERDTDATFVELRATKNGRIIGCTACGPTAAELANSMGIAITNRLTVRDVAQSIHSYPSHSYLLNRVALSMALSNVRGLLASCGPVGKALGNVVNLFGTASGLVRSAVRLPSSRKKMRLRREWEARGASQFLYLQESNVNASFATYSGDIQPVTVSFLTAFSNATLRDELGQATRGNISSSEFFALQQAESFLDWRQSEP